ncbi:MAG: SCO family protein [Verrucomicrobiota bacterium]
MAQTSPGNAGASPFRTLWIGIVLLALILGLAALVTTRQSQIPLPVWGTVADFTLTNQLGQPVTLANLRGKVWLADIIFTRCPGPCARMTRQMAEIQAALAGRSEVQLISLTTDPDFDVPAVLEKYAAHYQAQPGRWQFLTGPKLTIAAVAADSLKFTALEKPAEQRTSADDLFIHSTTFVLVDKQGRLRANFDTSSEITDWAAVRKEILAAIKQLEREP